MKFLISILLAFGIAFSANDVYVMVKTKKGTFASFNAYIANRADTVTNFQAGRTWTLSGHLTPPATFDFSTILSSARFYGSTGSAVDTLDLRTCKFSAIPSHQWIDTSLTVLLPSLPSVRPEWWGKTGTALQRAIAACPAKVCLIISDTITTNGGIVTAKEIHISGGGKIKTITGQNYDQVLSLSGDNSTVENITIDQTPTWSNTGRNEGLRIIANNWNIDKVKIYGNGDSCDQISNPYSYTFYLGGSGNISNSMSNKPGYAGIKCFGTDSNTIKISNFSCYNRHYKGVVWNGSGKSLIINGLECTAPTDTGYGGLALLVDNGATDTLHEVIVSNVDAKGGDIKFASTNINQVKKVSLSNIHCNYRSTYSASSSITLRCSNALLDNIYCKNMIRLQTNSVSINNLYSDVSEILPSGNGSNIQIDNYCQFNLTNSFLTGATVCGINASESDSLSNIKIDNVTLTAGDSVEMFAIGSSGNAAFKIQMGKYTILGADSSLTGTEADDHLIRYSRIKTIKNDIPFDSQSVYNTQDNILLVNSSRGAGSGYYGPSIGFGGPGIDVRRAAIVARQEAADGDKIGLDILTHPSGTGGDSLSLTMRIGMNSANQIEMFDTTTATATVAGLKLNGGLLNFKNYYGKGVIKTTDTTPSTSPTTGALTAVSAGIGHVWSDSVHSAKTKLSDSTGLVLKAANGYYYKIKINALGLITADSTGQN